MTVTDTQATLNGQVALITGGTDGIGKECALKLAQAGADLILVGRSDEKGARAKSEISAAVPNSRVTFWQYDLSLMRSVHALAEAIQKKYPQLDMLVHSAGVMRPRLMFSSEGVEMVFAVQYLARYSLTHALLPQLNAQSRIVNVSAAGTMPIRLDFDNLNGQKFYHGVYALMHESIANDLFALRFIRQHPTIRFYGYGPFYVRTGLFTDMPWWFKLSTATFGRLVATTPQVAAQDVANLLMGDRPNGLYSRHLKLIRPTRYRSDSVVQERLAEVSERMVANALQRAIH